MKFSLHAQAVWPCAGLKVAQMFPKVNNIFGLLLRANLLARTLKNRPIWSHCAQAMTMTIRAFEADSIALSYSGQISDFKANVSCETLP